MTSTATSGGASQTGADWSARWRDDVVDRRSPRRTAGWLGIGDLVTVAVLTATGLVGLVHVFGGWWFLPAAITGAAAGLAIAWAGAHMRWSALAVALAVVLAYVIVGGPLVHPDTVLVGVLPSLTSLRELALGAVHVWKGFVTAPVPVVDNPELVAVPLIISLVATALAGSVALRARRPAWALLPLVVVLVATIGLSTAQPTWPVWQGGGFALVSAVWLAVRRVEHRPFVDGTGLNVQNREDLRRLRQRRVLASAGMLGAVGLLVTVFGPQVVSLENRRVIRDQVRPPVDLREYASPLEAFRRYVKDFEDDVLFVVDGLPEGARLRMAVLDTYTGSVLDVAGGDPSDGSSGTFEAAGAAMRESASEPGSSATVQVEVVGYRGVWVPSAGLPTSVTLDGARAEELSAALYVNSTTGTMVDTAGLREGDTYTVSVVLAQVPDWDDLESAELTRVDPGSQYQIEAIAQAARSFVGEELHPETQVRLVRDGLVANGVFSDGLEGQPASPPGHGAWRLTELVSGEDSIGDDEQFAVAAALMVRSLGYDSRVVMGLYPEATEEGEASGASMAAPPQVELRGTDVHAWVEVLVEGVGWVPLDVTPDDSQVTQEQDPRSNREPQVTVVEEPPTPEEPDLAPQPPLAQDDDLKEDDPGLELGLYLRIAAMVGTPLVLLAGALATVAVLKSRRRRRRRNAAHPAFRFSGGWHEVTDAVVDLGGVVDPGATRHETADDLHTRYGGVQMLTVAQRADRAVFSSAEPTDADIADFWSEVDALVTNVRREVGAWRRFRARFSLRSLTWHRRAVIRRRPRPEGR